MKSITSNSTNIVYCEICKCDVDISNIAVAVILIVTNKITSIGSKGVFIEWKGN